MYHSSLDPHPCQPFADFVITITFLSSSHSLYHLFRAHICTLGTNYVHLAMASNIPNERYASMAFQLFYVLPSALYLALHGSCLRFCSGTRNTLPLSWEIQRYLGTLAFESLILKLEVDHTYLDHFPWYTAKCLEYSVGSQLVKHHYSTYLDPLQVIEGFPGVGL